MISVRFLGAAQEVTGSMHLVETKHGRILIDCGFFQGRREEARLRNRDLPKEAIAADVVILTHAHIDHSGSIPTLCKRGFSGRVWATPATRDLASFMLRDSARIQEGDAAYVNRRAEQGDVRVEPIYTEEDAVRALDRFETAPYGQAFTPLPGVTARFIEAGHILGSAQVVLEVEGKKKERLVFSGDLGRRGLPILRDPEFPDRPDHLFMESTYGNRVHGSIDEMHDQLERIVKATISKGGKLLIPAFAVGRTQEVVYALNQLYQAGRLPEVPVFIDSPLATEITGVFVSHPECYDDETRRFVQDSGSPFSFRALRYVASREESMRLNSLREPAIIIASSGMCEAGRILHHLRNGVSDERNTILIVGFQAQHTLGRRLVERRKKVRIFGIEHELFAGVEIMNAFSAHADRNDLAEYAHHARGSRHVFLIHGEPDQQEPLQKLLQTDGLSVTIPRRGDVVDL